MSHHTSVFVSTRLCVCDDVLSFSVHAASGQTLLLSKFLLHQEPYWSKNNNVFSNNTRQHVTRIITLNLQFQRNCQSEMRRNNHILVTRNLRLSFLGLFSNWKLGKRIPYFFSSCGSNPLLQKLARKKYTVTFKSVAFASLLLH